MTAAFLKALLDAADTLEDETSTTKVQPARACRGHARARHDGGPRGHTHTPPPSPTTGYRLAA